MCKVVLVLVLIWIKFSDSAGGQKSLKIDRFIQCPEYKNLTIVALRTSLQHVGKDYVTSVKLEVLETTTNKLKVGLQMVRCKSREALDTCETVPDMNFANVCFLINSKMPPFGAAIRKVNPILKCPLEKGNYTLTNYIMDGASLSVFPLEGWYWKTHVLIYDQDKIIGCLYYESSIIYI